jgi:hypothetical protein
VVTVLAVGMAVIFDILFLIAQRRLTRWQTAGEATRRRRVALGTAAGRVKTT